MLNFFLFATKLMILPLAIWWLLALVQLCGDEQRICGYEERLCSDEQSLCGDEQRLCGNEQRLSGDEQRLCGDEQRQWDPWLLQAIVTALFLVLACPISELCLGFALDYDITADLEHSIGTVLFLAHVTLSGFTAFIGLLMNGSHWLFSSLVKSFNHLTPFTIVLCPLKMSCIRLWPIHRCVIALWFPYNAWTTGKVR